MIKDATISECELYRYTLSRIWDESLPVALFVLVNPSKADASIDDHTLRKGVGFAKRWGYGGVIFVNLFAFRATKPKDMKAAVDPIGPENDAHILREVERAEKVILAWGNNGTHRGRDKAVIKMIQSLDCGEKLFCLGKSKGGHPLHPLTLSYETPLEAWS